MWGAFARSLRPHWSTETTLFLHPTVHAEAHFRMQWLLRLTDSSVRMTDDSHVRIAAELGFPGAPRLLEEAIAGLPTGVREAAREAMRVAGFQAAAARGRRLGALQTPPRTFPDNAEGDAAAASFAGTYHAAAGFSSIGAQYLSHVGTATSPFSYDPAEVRSIGFAVAATRALDPSVWGTGVDPRDRAAARMSEVRTSRGHEERDERLGRYVDITFGMLRTGDIVPADLFSVDVFSADEISGALSGTDDDLRALIRRAFPPTSNTRPPSAMSKRRFVAKKLGGVKTDPTGITDPILRLSFMYWMLWKSFAEARRDAEREFTSRGRPRFGS